MFSNFCNNQTFKNYFPYLCLYVFKEIENITANGEIACFEQFLLLSQCFQNYSAPDMSENVRSCIWSVFFIFSVIYTISNQTFSYLYNLKSYFQLSPFYKRDVFECSNKKLIRKWDKMATSFKNFCMTFLGLKNVKL